MAMVGSGSECFRACCVRGTWLSALCSPVIDLPRRVCYTSLQGLSGPTSQCFWPDSCCILRWMEEVLNCVLVRTRVCIFTGLQRGDWGYCFSCVSAGTFLWLLASVGDNHVADSSFLDLVATLSHLEPESVARNRQPHSSPLYCHQGRSRTSPRWALTFSTWARKGIRSVNRMCGKICLLLWGGNRRYVLQYFCKDTIFLKR